MSYLSSSRRISTVPSRRYSQKVQFTPRLSGQRRGQPLKGPRNRNETIRRFGLLKLGCLWWPSNPSGPRSNVRLLEYITYHLLHMYVYNIVVKRYSPFSFPGPYCLVSPMLLRLSVLSSVLSSNSTIYPALSSSALPGNSSGRVQVHRTTSKKPVRAMSIPENAVASNGGGCPVRN